MLHKANIAGMTVDPESNTPIIILKLPQKDQTIPIWIGLFEASSIASALQNIQFDRPMTHDLFKNLLEKLHVTVSSVEVYDLIDNTFFGRINFSSIKKTFTIDARPSDAIAIALRFKAPIYIDDKVIKKSKTTNLTESSEMLDKSEEGKKWAEYLSKLSPEDFGKYKT